MTVLRLDGRPVARVNAGDDLPQEHSPRPYLHPLWTPSGVEASAVAPADHPWHAGLSLAIADVDGDNFWGGNSFVAGRGYVLLDDHGRVEARRPPRVEGESRIDLDLLWRKRSGEPVLVENRTVGVEQAPGDRGGWVVTARSALANVTDRPVALGSPGTRGRPDAGYGGWTLRLADRFRGARVTTSESDQATGDVGEAAMGRPARWVRYRADGLQVTVTDLLPPGRPTVAWYVRVHDFPAVGPAPFFTDPVRLDPGAVLPLGVSVELRDTAGDPL